MQSIMVMLNYGYNAYRGKSVELTPFVGIGTITYSHFLDNKDHTRLERDGFSCSIGVITDVVLNHSFDFKTYGRNSTNLNTLRIKPSFNLTHYSSPLGWVPSINVSLEYDWFGRF